MLTTNLTKEHAKDTGMALVLILLVLFAYTRRDRIVLAAIALHVVNMTVPHVYRPAAIVWFGLANLLQTVVSKVILGIVFFAVVTPVGVCRRLLGLDSLQLKRFKAGRDSVMHERNHTYTGSDIEQPY